ncbi:hypothetical protein PsorP6_010593 [Peronosclerospora sorghi]|uniref:Uncharacterized protein n=1 Tax=Peronosclerospora sorghi TaxID=230839 RepID=A0ACC0VX84_9STRA|nr:hypothetical protein PsorP6_010593 [Peronosclerospora sorghi]
MKTDYKKRKKLQHLAADRLMLKYDGDVMAKNMDASHSLWRRLQQGDYVAWTGNSMRPRSNTRSARNSFYGLFNVGGARQIDTDDESIEAKVTMAEVTGSVRR